MALYPGKYDDSVLPYLPPAEQLVVATNAVVPAASKGVSFNLGGMIGNRLARLGAISGDKDSIAAGIPTSQSSVVLAVTGSRVGLWGSLDGKQNGELWSVARTHVAGVRRRPRLQLLAKYRLHFDDGSSAALMTPQAHTVEVLQEVLGTHS